MTVGERQRSDVISIVDYLPVAAKGDLSIFEFGSVVGHI